jgi:hypothetical protein
MTDINKLYKLISARELSKDDEFRLRAIAEAAGIPIDDPLFMNLVVMDAFYGCFSDLPRDATNAAQMAAKTAAETASAFTQKRIAESVAVIIPTIEREIKSAVAPAVANAVRAAAIGPSLMYIFFGVLIAIILIIGSLLSGYDIAIHGNYGPDGEDLLKLNDIRKAIAAGILYPVLFLFGYWAFNMKSDDGETPWARYSFGFLMISLAVVGLIISIFLPLYQFFLHMN